MPFKNAGQPTKVTPPGETVLVQLQQTGTLAASTNILSISGAGRIVYFSVPVTVTNTGPGGVGPLSMGFSPNTGNMSIAYGSSCTGATLAAGASCTFKVAFVAGCPLASSSRATLSITGPQSANVASVAVGGNTLRGICR